MEYFIVDIAKLLLAIGIGALIGVEREKSKPAGIRTLSVVCMASAFFVMVSMKHFPVDTARVLAGVITGVGFLGAGAIIADQGSVHGLTTAATIWATAILGMGIGIGEYALAIAFGVLIYLILIEGKIKRKIKKKKSLKD